MSGCLAGPVSASLSDSLDELVPEALLDESLLLGEEDGLARSCSGVEGGVFSFFLTFPFPLPRHEHSTLAPQSLGNLAWRE